MVRGWYRGTGRSSPAGIRLNGYRRMYSRKLPYYTMSLIDNMTLCTPREGDLMISVYTKKIGTQRYSGRNWMFITLIIMI